MTVADLGLGHIRLEAGVTPEDQWSGTEYGPPGGYNALRSAIAQWENVSIDDVAVTTGASMAIVATLATLKRPCCVLCPRPYYPAYPTVADMLGIDVVFYELERELGWQARPGSLTRCLRHDTKALVWNCPSNPTGSLPCPELVDEVRDLAHRFDLLVLSDEVYADFVYDAGEVPDMRAIMGSQYVVRVRSFSKTLGIPGERLGYVVASPERVAAICRAHWTLAMGPPATSQRIGLAALQNGAAARVRHVKRLLAENRSHVTEVLAGAAGLDYVVPAGGVFCWIGLADSPLDSQTLAHACASRAGVVVAPGVAFGQHTPAYVRASFAVPKNEATRGFDTLVKFLETIRRETCYGATTRSN